MMRSLGFLVMVLIGLVFCHLALGDELLVANPERSYVLETEISAIVTVHGDQWVLQAEFPRADVLGDGWLPREVNLRPRRAQLHLGRHVDVAFRVPAGPPVPPAFRDHVSYDAIDVQVRLIPPPDFQKREILVFIMPFVANGKRYQVKAPAGDGNPIPLMPRVPLP
jgi:hypothetical protein